VTCVLGMLVESKYPSQQEAVALVLLSFGVMLAVWQGTVEGEPYAISFSCGATLCNGLMMTFSSKLLRFAKLTERTQNQVCTGTFRFNCLACSEKLDVIRLTFYIAPISLVCLAPFFWAFEVRVCCCMSIIDAALLVPLVVNWSWKPAPRSLGQIVLCCVLCCCSATSLRPTGH
jgi:drug/metabolite transporter (DMT)-like permease